MGRNAFAFPLLLLLTLAPAAPAQEAGSRGTEDEIRAILDQDRITLNDLFRLADLANPTLAAARSAAHALKGQARQAGLYPNPTLEFGVEDMSASDPDHRTDKVALVQPLVLSGRRGNAVAAARAEQEAAVHSVHDIWRDLYRRIHSLWAEQLYFRDADAAFDELLHMAQRTLEVAETRLAARAAPESHVTKALLEVYDLEAARQHTASERIRGSAQLAALLDGLDIPYDRLAGGLNPADIIAGAKAYHEQALANHPAAQAAKKAVTAAEASLREAKASRVPDLDLFVAYAKARTADEEILEAGISVPLPLFNRNQGRIAKSRSLIAQARDRVRIVENDLQVAFDAAHARYQTIGGQLQSVHNRIEPAAEGGLAQAQEAYRAGSLPFLELIEAQRTLAGVRLRKLELARDLIAAEAELMSLTGTGPYSK